MFTVIGYNFAERYEYSIGGFCRFGSMFNEMEFIFLFHDGIEWKKIILKNEITHKINRFRPKNTHKNHAKGI